MRGVVDTEPKVDRDRGVVKDSDEVVKVARSNAVIGSSMVND